MASWQEARDAYWYDGRSREETLAFQLYFKRRARRELDAWYEVVRWKSPRSAGKTRNYIQQTGITANALLRRCQNYMKNPTVYTFRSFRTQIAKTDVVATSATFPAFLRPDLFPMVDTQVTKWVENNPWTGMVAPRLGKAEVLHERHWNYIWEWIQWCRETATTLGPDWTPRDVEMAVFTAQRSGLLLPQV